MTLDVNLAKNQWHIWNQHPWIMYIWCITLILKKKSQLYRVSQGFCTTYRVTLRMKPPMIFQMVKIQQVISIDDVSIEIWDCGDQWRNDRPRRPRNAGGRRPKGGARRAPRRISMAPVGRQAGFWIRLKGALKVFGSAQRAPWLFEGAPSGRPLQFGGGAPRALRRRQWKSWKNILFNL